MKGKILFVFHIFIVILMLVSCKKEDNPVKSTNGHFSSIYGTVTDIDSNTYTTVKIGNQWWMSENLRVTRYLNGDSIMNIKEADTWSRLKTGAYCSYENKKEFSDTYGLLYNRYAVIDSHQLAPEGWHIPTDEEFNTLLKYLGGTSDAGAKLKENGYDHWKVSDYPGTNESKFNALPGGIRYPEGENYHSAFVGIRETCSFWTDGLGSWHLRYNTSEIVYQPGIDSKFGLSVRCIKD
jgi:uncharacterized protein (TIGR02145 family)